MPAQLFIDLFKSNPTPEMLVRQGLRLLEGDLREQALLALADWVVLQTGTPAAVPELFSAIAALQRPSWGSWNGLLTALRKARNNLVREGNAELCGPLEQATDLHAVLARLEEACEPAFVQGLDRLSKLVRSKLPNRPRLAQVLALPISLRNRMAHDMPSDPAWWEQAAQALRPLLGYHARPGTTERTTLPAPWFVVEADQVWSFNGIDHDGAVIYVSRQGATRSDTSASQAVLLAFQRLLGKSDIQERDFKKLLATLAPEDVKGVLLGDYLLGPPVGAGGFATVHVGRQLSTGRKVAIKILRDGMDDEQRLRFQQEAAYLAQFDHPNIVSVLGHGEETWSPPRSFSLSGEAWFEQLRREAPIKSYIALEWIDGQTLDGLIADSSRKPLRAGSVSDGGLLPSLTLPARSPHSPDVRVVADWFAQTSEALAAVHAAGLIHRDLKPSNVMVTTDGRIKLMDFGIARSQADSRTLHTATGQMLGTPAYMAPEQLTANEAQAAIGPLSDVYGVSATFYELFTGARLFNHDTLDHATVLTRKLSGEKPESPRRLAPDLPWEIATLLLGGLEREPKDRPQSAADLAADLRRFLADRPIAYRTPSVRRRAMLFYRRNRATVRVVTPILGVLSVVAMVLGYFWYTANEAAQQLEGKVGGLTGEVASAKKGREAAEGTAATATKEAKTSERLKVRADYLADIRLLPVLATATAGGGVPQMRTILKKYEDGKPEELRGFEWHYWNRKVNSDGQAWKADGRVTSLDWAPDGKTLYGSDVTGQVLAWDIATGTRRCLWKPTIPAAQVVAAPTGDRLAVLTRSSQTYSATIIEGASGKQVAAASIRSPIDAAAFSQDATRLATSSWTQLYLWNALDGKLIIDLVHNERSRRQPTISTGVLDSHNGHIYTLACNPTDTGLFAKLVASAGEDRNIGLWYPNGTFRGWLRGHKGSVVSVAFSKDGSKILSRALPAALGDQIIGDFNITSTVRVAAPGEIILWDLKTGSKPVRTIEIPGDVKTRAQRGGNYRADWVLDERFVAVGVGPVVKFFDLGGGVPPADRLGHTAPIVSLRASPGGTLLATADELGEVRVWDLARRNAEETLLKFHAPVRGLVRPRDGTRFAVLQDAGIGVPSSGIEFVTEKKVVSFYDRPGAAPLRPEKAVEHYDGIAYSPGGKHVAAVNAGGGQIVVWDAVTGKLFKTHDVRKLLPKSKGLVKLQCIAFRADDELYVAGRSRLWRLRTDTGDFDAILDVPVGSEPNLGAEDVVQVPGNAVMALGFNPDGSRAVLGTADGDLAIYDATTWKLVKQLPRRHRRGVIAIAFSADGRRLASCSGRYFVGQNMEGRENPGEIMIWDTATWEDSLTLECAQEGEFAGVAFTSEGRGLHAAHNARPPSRNRMPRGEIVGWDAAAAPVPVAAGSPSKLAGKVYKSGYFTGIGGVQGFLTAAIQPTGRFLAAFTIQHKILLWDLQTGELVREVPIPQGPFTSSYARLRFSADGQFLKCSDGNNGSVHAMPNLSQVDAKAFPATKASPEESALMDGKIILEAKGTLVNADPFDTAKKLAKSHRHVHPLKMEAGVSYTIRLDSDEFDAFLRLENSAGKQLAQDDDSGGDLNARILHRAAATGDASIIVTSAVPGTGAYRLTVQQKNPELPDRIYSTSFSSDRALAALVTGPIAPKDDAPFQIHVFQVKDKKKLFSAKLDGKPLFTSYSVDRSWGFAPDGLSVYAFAAPPGVEVSKTKEFTFHRWAVPSGENQPAIEGISFPRGLTADATCCLELLNEFEIHTRDLISGKLSPAPVGIERGLRGAVFFPDGEHFATFGIDNTVRVWNRHTPLPAGPGLLFRADHGAYLAISPDGRKVALSEDLTLIGSSRRGVVVFDRDKKARLRASGSLGHGVARVAFAPDGQRLVALAPPYNNLLAVDTATGAMQAPEPLPTAVPLLGIKTVSQRNVQVLAVQPLSGNRILYLIDPRQIGSQTPRGKSPPSLILWDGRQARFLPAPNRPVRMAAFSPRGGYLATASNNGAIAILALPDLTVIATMQADAGAITSLEFSADAKRLDVMSGSTYLAFDAISGKNLARVPGLDSRAFAVSPDGKLCARVLKGGKIVVVKAADQAEVARFDGHADGTRVLRFFPDGISLASAGGDNAVRLWELKGIPPTKITLEPTDPAPPKVVPMPPPTVVEKHDEPAPPKKIVKRKSPPPPAPVKFEDVVAKARGRLLADFDNALPRLEKQLAAGTKTVVSLDHLKKERIRFEKDGVVPWSEPMRPFSVRYLADLRGPGFAAKDAKVVARWRHQPGNAIIRLLSNGKIDDPNGQHNWQFAGGKLTLRWRNGKARGGFWVDACDITPDGLRYSGQNQNKTRVSGVLVTD